MGIFNLITPLIYWILILIWFYIFIFYLRKFLAKNNTDKFLKILLIILAIDAFRTLFESIYFGARLTALSEILPLSIYTYLSQPHLIFIPKLFNLIVSILILVLIIRKWLPEEARRISNLNKEIKATAKELADSEEYNRLLFNESTIGLALSTMDGKLVDVNPAYAKIIGRTVDETIKLTYWELTPEKYIPQQKFQLDYLKDIGEYGPFEKEYIHKNGDLVPVRLNGKIIERNGIKFIWSNVENNTERKKAEEEIKKMNAELEQKVAVRTSELKQKNADLEKMNKIFVGRELRMAELKKCIKKLEDEKSS